MYKVNIFWSSRGLFTPMFESAGGKAVQQQQQHRSHNPSVVPPSWFLPSKNSKFNRRVSSCKHRKRHFSWIIAKLLVKIKSLYIVLLLSKLGNTKQLTTNIKMIHIVYTLLYNRLKLLEFLATCTLTYRQIVTLSKYLYLLMLTWANYW